MNLRPVSGEDKKGEYEIESRGDPYSACTAYAVHVILMLVFGYDDVVIGCEGCHVELYQFC